MTLKEIEKEFYDKKREYEKMYREEMEKELERVGFKDVDVIRVHDGVKGRIYVSDASWKTDFPYEYQFHPYTKKGILSKNQSGWIGSIIDTDVNKYKVCDQEGT